MAGRLLCCFLFLWPSSLAAADVISERPIDAVPNKSAVVKRALRYLQLGDPDAARAVLQAFTAKVADELHSEILMAQLLNQLQRGSDARSVLEQLAAAEPDRFDVHLVFCELAVRESRWLDGWMHAKAAQKTEMPAAWSQDFTAQQTQKLMLLKATCCEGRKDWQTAQTIYDSLKTADKNLSVALQTAMGRTAFHLDDLPSARQHFAMAFEQDESLNPPDLTLALLCDGAGNLEAAETHFLASLNSQSNPEQARLAYARWLIFQNQAIRATEIVTGKFENTELEPERLYVTGLAARMNQKFEHAQTIFQSLHQADPGSFAVGNQLALVLIENTSETLRARGLQIAESNVRNNSNLAEAWSTLGWIQLRLGDVALARESLSRAASAGTLSRDTACYLAELHQQLGSTAEAQQLFAAARTSSGPLFRQLAEPISEELRNSSGRPNVGP